MYVILSHTYIPLTTDSLTIIVPREMLHVGLPPMTAWVYQLKLFGVLGTTLIVLMTGTKPGSPPPPSWVGLWGNQKLWGVRATLSDIAVGHLAGTGPYQ